MSHRLRLPVVAVLVALVVVANAWAMEIDVASSADLRAVLQKLSGQELGAGTTVTIRPGRYRGDFVMSNVVGTERSPVVIQGADPDNPPVFTGRSQGLQLIDCGYVTLRNLEFRGYPQYGLHLNDGGTFQTPTHHITVENVTILDTGPRGNTDAVKMAGVDHFVFRNCRIEGWGDAGIDMVGCHHGVIEDCYFAGRPGSGLAKAVGMKGGSSDILVQTSFFKEVGNRGVNIGGSTGLAFFRPRNATYEATRITVAGNRFVGGKAAVAFATADGGHVHHNTIINPGQWVLRILQETKNPRFIRSRNGVFEDNLIVLGNDLRATVNIGPLTRPETFTFRHNAWFQPDGDFRPELPTPEKEGVYGVDPKLENVGTPDMRVTSKDRRLKGIGADAYVRPENP